MPRWASSCTFLKRLRSVPEQPLPGAAAARELLAARGLGAATIPEVEDLLKKLPTVREPPSPIGPTLEEQTVAENAMWDEPCAEASRSSRNASSRARYRPRIWREILGSADGRFFLDLLLA